MLFNWYRYCLVDTALAQGPGIDPQNLIKLAWWACLPHMPTLWAPRRWRQEHQKFKILFSYTENLRPTLAKGAPVSKRNTTMGLLDYLASKSSLGRGEFMLLSVAVISFCFLTSGVRVFHIPHQHSSCFYVLTIAIQTAVGHCLIKNWICISLTNKHEIPLPSPIYLLALSISFFFF